MSIQDTIKQQLADSKIVLYMKGTPDFPQCGFSGRSVMILNELGAKFAAYNVLEDPDLRQGIKDFSQWPTIPQLYINGELIGGSDIMFEMYESGELAKLVSSE